MAIQGTADFAFHDANKSSCNHADRTKDTSRAIMYFEMAKVTGVHTRATLK